MNGTLEGVMNRNGFLYIILLAISFNACQTIILIFPEERPVFLREAHNKLYTVSAYFFGKLIAEIPLAILVPILNSSIVYFYLGLNPDTFFMHCWIEILVYTAGAAYTLIISVAFDEKKLAVTLIPVLLIPLQLVSGFFVTEKRYPFFLMPLAYISFYKYGF
jgi:ATP-binding cassette, subfamily G (WHITE), eye pigment precursor transporter